MSDPKSVNLKVLKANLHAAGLNLCSVFSARKLSDSLQKIKLPSNCQNLLLIGNAGSTIWDRMPAEYFARDHPIDEYSKACVTQALAEQIPLSCWQLLYPLEPDLRMPLQDLGVLAGWHNPSPLGIGISHRYGLWFAYRALVALDAEIIEAFSADNSAVNGADELLADLESPCVNCIDAPCLSVCPANALAKVQPPNLNACVKYRCAEQSSCASTCVARQACPVAREYQYSDAQIKYFYDRSLVSLKRWVNSGG